MGVVIVVDVVLVVAVMAVVVDTLVGVIAKDLGVTGVVNADVVAGVLDILVLDVDGFVVEDNALITVMFSMISLAPVLVTSVPLFIFVIVGDEAGLVVKIMGTVGLSWPINSMIPNSGIRLISSDGVV